MQDVELGFLALPESSDSSSSSAGPHPGVVLIPDVRGLYDHFRDLARRLAAEGFGVLAVDLYRREGPPQIESPKDALRWIRGLSDPRVLQDVQAATDFLTGHAAVGGRKVGVTGFCMGGQYALLAACTCRGLSACVPFYGMLAYQEGLDPTRKPRSPLEALADLTCPVLGLYGREDALIPLADVRRLKEGLAKIGQPWEVVLYPGAGHAFVNDTRPETYRPEAARDGWGRMVTFFRQHLA